MKHEQFQHVLENQNVSIRLRSKVFDSIVFYAKVFARLCAAYHWAAENHVATHGWVGELYWRHVRKKRAANET